LTPASQNSIFSSFAQTATVVARVRNFVDAIYKQALRTDPSQSATSPRKLTRTLEAFAEAVDSEIKAFDAWCASREDAFCLARAGAGGVPHIISLLSLEKAVRDDIGDTFNELLRIAQHVMQRISRSRRDEQQPSILVDSPLRVSPAVSVTILLDTVLAAVKERTMMADEVTTASLMRVFIFTMEPMWDMIGSWLRNGACSERIEAEFFVEDNELPLTDLDFWSEGYILRDDTDQDYSIAKATRTTAIPEFIRESHVAEMILAAGKAIGLLRSLGIEPVIDPVLRQNWKSFSKFLVDQGLNSQGKSSMLVSTDLLSRSINEEVQSVCESVGIQLTEVLVSDGDLWRHLKSIEDLYFMRRGDIVGQFVDILFIKVNLNIKSC
jgi:gamma-tubulin complex component 5